MQARPTAARTHSRIAHLVSLAGLATGLAASSAHGQTLNWNNAAGGSASVAANWNPSQVPTGSSLLVWNLANTYTVTWNSSVIASNTHTLKKGVVTYSLSTPHTIGSGGLKVGDVSGDSATLTVTTGTLNSTGSAIVGNAAGSSGTLNVNDDDAEFVVTGATSDLTIASNAPGTMNITGGGLVQVADQFIAGNNSSGTSTVTVSGATSSLPMARSTLSVLGTSQSRFGQGGDATVNISNGALANFAGDVTIANGSASTSTVTIAGKGGLIPTNAKLSVAGSLLVGRNTSASSAAGNATLNVNADLDVGGTLFLAGDPDGGTALFHTAVGSITNTHSINIGQGATLDLDGGDINISGGVLSNTGTTSLDLNGGTGGPIINLRSNASAVLPSIGGVGLRLGNGTGANLADLNILSSSDVVVSGNMLLGVGADDNGNLLVNGSGSSLSNAGSTMIVGVAGRATFQAELGASVSGGQLWVARDAGSNSGVLFENAGTTAQFDAFFVGGSNTVGGGNGDLNVNAGATFNQVTSTTSVVWPIGFLQVINGGTLNALSAGIDIRGVVAAGKDGTLNAHHLNLLSGALLQGPSTAGVGSVNARVHMMTGSTIDFKSGDLTLGLASASDGFAADDGTLIAVGSHTLTLNDADFAQVDDVTINGGEIIAPNGLELVGTGQNGRLDGTGTITGQVFFESGGSVITSTGANGITFNGQLLNHSGNIDGTRYTFNDNTDITPTCGWTGAGAINARVTFNNNTEVIATSNMTLGANATDGVVFNTGSRIRADRFTVTLVDSNGVTLASYNELQGGIITSAANLSLTTNRLIVGDGKIICPAFTMTGGTISPSKSLSPADPIGLLTFDPATAFIMSGSVNSPVTYNCDIGSLSVADHLRVEGAATLDGTLNVTLLNGFVMPRGSRVSIASITGPLTGWFTTLNMPWGLRLVESFTDETILQVFNCPPDINSDGFVNGDDYDAFASAFEGGEPLADFNQDGFVNGDDYDLFASEFEQGC